MKYVFIILLTAQVSAQIVEFNAVTYSIVSGITMAYEIKDRQAYADGNPIYRDYQKTWRLLLPVEAVTLVNLGFSIAIEDRERWDLVATDVILSGAIRWLVRDGVYQWAQGKNFFELPNTDNTYFPSVEKLGSAYFKIGLVAVILLFKYLVLK